jgi:hypothetical protein
MVRQTTHQRIREKGYAAGDVKEFETEDRGVAKHGLVISKKSRTA